MLVIFSLKNVKQGQESITRLSDGLLARPQTRGDIFICLLDHAYEALLADIEMERQRWPKKLLIWGGLEPSMLPW